MKKHTKPYVYNSSTICETYQYEKFYNEFQRLKMTILPPEANDFSGAKNSIKQIAKYFIVRYMNEELLLGNKLICDLLDMPVSSIDSIHYREYWNDNFTFSIYHELKKNFTKLIINDFKEFVESYENFINKYKDTSWQGVFTINKKEKNECIKVTIRDY